MAKKTDHEIKKPPATNATNTIDGNISNTASQMERGARQSKEFNQKKVDEEYTRK
jgi:hypothetical protein